MPTRLRLGSTVLILSSLLLVSASGAGSYASYSDVQAILDALTDILPSELKIGGDAEARSTAWNAWVARHDLEIRARLDRGDADTLVNWLLLGTSFTSKPTASFELASTNSDQFLQLIEARSRDLVAALSVPNGDERRVFGRRVLERLGYGFDSALRREEAAVHLLTEVARVAREQRGYGDELAGARSGGDATAEFAAASRLYRARGLSLDTSILPGFAVERALMALRDAGLMPRGSVRDVAVIGPGLDFADKTSGYDFYPLQTLQPFVIIDSLIRLGLTERPESIRLTTLDLSPRVNGHLSDARERASRGVPYLIRTPLDFGYPWKAELAAYWGSVGERIGTVNQPTDQPQAGQEIRLRTLSVRPETVLQVYPEDLNVVVQRAEERFDLIVATNVFVYYDVLDQALAASNVAAMLRPGGVLLSNNALIELPSSNLRSVGYLTVQYSDRPDDGDHVVWYRRLTK